MRHRFSVFTVLSALILAIIFVVYPKGEVSAEIADGSYQVNYEMKENNSENTSIADGYFSSPATLTVENGVQRSEEHTSELQSRFDLVCRPLLEKKQIT